MAERDVNSKNFSLVLEYKNWVKALSLFPIPVLSVLFVYASSITELEPVPVIGAFIILSLPLFMLINSIEYTVNQSGIDRHYFKWKHSFIGWDQIGIIYVNAAHSLTIRSTGREMMILSEYFKRMPDLARLIQQKVTPERWIQAKKWIDDLAVGK
jgi:hypothetical protein